MSSFQEYKVCLTSEDAILAIQSSIQIVLPDRAVSSNSSSAKAISSE